MGYRIFSLKSMRGQLYPLGFGAGEVLVGLGRRKIFMRSMMQPRSRSPEGRGSPVFGWLHGWVSQRRGPPGPVLTMVLF